MINELIETVCNRSAYAAIVAIGERHRDQGNGTVGEFISAGSARAVLDKDEFPAEVFFATCVGVQDDSKSIANDLKLVLFFDFVLYLIVIFLEHSRAHKEWVPSTRLFVCGHVHFSGVAPSDVSKAPGSFWGRPGNRFGHYITRSTQGCKVPRSLTRKDCEQREGYDFQE